MQQVGKELRNDPIRPRKVDALPGLWGGIDYDFVTGEGDGGNRGLPKEVEGCLSGT